MHSNEFYHVELMVQPTLACNEIVCPRLIVARFTCRGVAERTVIARGTNNQQLFTQAAPCHKVVQNIHGYHQSNFPNQIYSPIITPVSSASLPS